MMVDPDRQWRSLGIRTPGKTIIHVKPHPPSVQQFRRFLQGGDAAAAVANPGAHMRA
jgi:hypothetical protein